MSYAYLLHDFLLGVVEPVEITVDLLQTDILPEVPPQVVNRGFLAHRRAYPGHHQMTQFLVLYAIEPDPVVHFIDDRLKGLQGCPDYIG